MKKSSKTVFCISVCLFVALSLLAGCVAPIPQPTQQPTQQQQATAGQSSAAGTTAPEKPKEPLLITMINRVGATVSFENNDYIKAVEKAANVKLEIEAPPINNYNDRLKILMASGDYPDVVYVWLLDNFYEMWAADGILIPLDDKISNYPNLMSNITRNMWEVAKVSDTGKIHGVPKPNKVNYWGYVANQEWLDKLGVSAPTTIDELYTVAKAVATGDPDGNGKADTYAISPIGLWNGSDRWIPAAFNLCNSVVGIKDLDGQYKIREKFEGYYPYLEFMRKLYTEKLMDPEFFLNKTTDDQNKFIQNKIAFCYAHEAQLVQTFAPKITDGLEKLSFHPPLKNNNGDSVNFVTPPVWGAWTITNKAKDVDRILEFLDWGNSKEGFLLMNTGVKGVHYTEFNAEKGYTVKTEEQAEKSKVEFSSYTSIAYALDGAIASISSDEAYAERYNKDKNVYMQKITNVDVPAIKAPKLDNFATDYPDLVKKKDDMEIKYVTGEATLEELKAFIEKEYFPAIAEAEKEYLDIMANVK